MKQAPNTPLIVDRCAAKRTDDAWLKNALGEGLILPLWRNKNLFEVSTMTPRLVPSSEELLAAATAPIFLGVDAAQTPLFAIDLSAVDEPNQLVDGRFIDLRAALHLPEAHFVDLGYARGICRWHRTAKHCERCGARLKSTDAGFARQCDACNHRVFPRTDPAVMILITRNDAEHGDQCLLARQPRFPKGMVSTLAGFVEPGESLEDCVRRETLEEVGLKVNNLHYVGSQGWPFPASLMLGFRAEAEAGDIVLDEEELEEARWYTREELRSPKGFFVPPPRSLSHTLIQQFIDEA